VLAILGIYIKIEKLSVVKRNIYLHISGWHTFDFRTLSSFIGDSWRRQHSRQRWRQVWWRWTRFFAPPACLMIPRCAMLARKAAVCLILMNHWRVMIHRSLHLSMPRTLKFPVCLFSDFSMRFLDQVLRILDRGMRQPFFGHFGHIRCYAHVELFWHYRTSLPCHSCWYVEILPDISCCF